ncbi:hypothetical protein F2Q68_00003858 [Brassica cretica]|uniref:Uncharacterized protein n=1 Tax=Brassica cretica TaxID=69181 RepID=A0A8S9J573_BRACR|nr:hypothetical protein F2Q68_00003858 [Brassica cretica]
MMEDHHGAKGLKLVRTMEDRFGTDDKDYTGILFHAMFKMFSPVHHEFGERHLRNGPKGTRAYARKPYCDASGNMVPVLFPDKKEMEFVE